MYADKLVKMINKAVDFLEYKARDENPPFEIPAKALMLLPGFLGDVILLTPVIRNLRYNFGENTIIDVIGNRNVLKLLDQFPYIDKKYPLDEISDRVSFLKTGNYDTVFLFNFPAIWAFASYQAKVSQRVSFSLERIGLNYPPVWPKLITHFVRSTPIYDKKPQWQVYMHTLRDLNLKVFNDYPEIMLTNDDLIMAKKLIKQIPAPRILIHATSGSPGKDWSLDNWAVIVKYLKEKFNCSIISTGLETDRCFYDNLSALSGIEIYNFCGKTSARETIALYRFLDVVVSLDTAPAHFAGLANVKDIIIIYGPTNQSQWIPYAPNSNVYQVYNDLICRPCLTRFCSHRNCINELSPEKVIDALDKIYIEKK